MMSWMYMWRNNWTPALAHNSYESFQFVAVNNSVELWAELKNASANTVILDDSAFFHSHTGSDKLHHAPQTGWYVYKWQTLVS